MDGLSKFFDSSQFMPHGHCFLWDPSILWLHVTSDAIIGISYYAITLAILFLARERKDLPFRSVVIRFGVFILLCGATHFFAIWVLWKPDYGAEGVVKALTAMVSALTAVITWKIIPLALKVPSPAQLQDMNFRLQQTNTKIEQEVSRRTEELETANIKLLKSEQKLSRIARQSEQQFRVLVEGVKDYAIYMLDPEGKIINWNVGAQRIKGFTGEEIIGQNFSRFYTDDDLKADEPKRTLRIALEEGVFENEVWRVRKDKSQFRAHVVMNPIYDDSHQLIGFAKITRDITARYEAEIELEKTREQLHQAQKMEMVGHLTGGIAHDFNNLLQTIMGGLALVSKLNADQKIVSLLDTTLKAANRGAKLTQQLLAFSRQQDLNPEISDINTLIHSLEILLRQVCCYGIQLKLDLADNVWLTEIDQAQFQSGLLNLVINARDALPMGGTIVIQTRNITLNQMQVVKLSDISAGPYVVVSVIDTGTGMTDDVKAKAIEPFFTTKDVGKGSGLGLSQVYGFVRQSNGQIEIESEVNKGTTVRLYLPKSLSIASGPQRNNLEGQDKAASGEQDRASAKSKPSTVLVVDDDPLVLSMTTEIVKSFGYQVHAAANAHQALKIVEGGTPFDVLFTDIVMPEGVNGFELAREVLKVRPTTRILMASGYHRHYVADREGLANIVLSKPYEISDLENALHKMTSTL